MGILDGDLKRGRVLTGADTDVRDDLSLCTKCGPIRGSQIDND